MTNLLMTRRGITVTGTSLLLFHRVLPLVHGSHRPHCRSRCSPSCHPARQSSGITVTGTSLLLFHRVLPLFHGITVTGTHIPIFFGLGLRLAGVRAAVQVNDPGRTLFTRFRSIGCPLKSPPARLRSTAMTCWAAGSNSGDSAFNSTLRGLRPRFFACSLRAVRASRLAMNCGEPLGRPMLSASRTAGPVPTPPRRGQAALPCQGTAPASPPCWSGHPPRHRDRPACLTTAMRADAPRALPSRG